jgi:Ca-activated chloride channel family protein
MEFLWPGMLLFLLALPLLIGIYLYLQGRRRRLAARYAGFGSSRPVQASQGGPVTGLSSGRAGPRRYIPPAFFLIGITVLIVSLARPQAVVSMPQMQGIVMLAFDVSGSMSATDMQPTRMEAAKAAAVDFVAHLPSTVKVGVVAFSDSGLSVLKPTNHPQEILDAIKRLHPQRGTSLAEGIQASLTVIAQSLDQLPKETATAPGPDQTEQLFLPPGGAGDSAILVLLSDGENNMAPDPVEAAKAAANYGVRIYTVGIGSPQGTDIKIDGFTIHTQLDEGQLKGIAQISGGEYYNASNADDLQKIYSNLAPKLVIQPERIEVTSLFAGASILILLMGGLISMLWFGRLM